MHAIYLYIAKTGDYFLLQEGREDSARTKEERKKTYVGRGKDMKKLA